jgi:hypothetical protein
MKGSEYKGRRIHEEKSQVFTETKIQVADMWVVIPYSDVLGY